MHTKYNVIFCNCGRIRVTSGRTCNVTAQIKLNNIHQIKRIQHVSKVYVIM